MHYTHPRSSRTNRQTPPATALQRASASLLGLALAAAMLMAPGTVAGQDWRFRPEIRPIMMVLVDTSGSMEYVPTNTDCPTGLSNCVPSELKTVNHRCSDGGDTTDARNRWTLTLEALTGKIKDFSCKEEIRNSSNGYLESDYDYKESMSHHRPFSCSQGDSTCSSTPTISQDPDGVLDAYKYHFKFGLMTFDSEPTTKAQTGLVPWSEYSSSSYAAESGMFSYGDAQRLVFPKCETVYAVNLGARRQEDGAVGSMISVGPNDNRSDLEAVNDAIQASLKTVRPYGGTPIAAMLDDLKFYLQDHADVKASGSQIGSGDPYHACRPRYAVLITDGKPDTTYRDSFNCNPTSQEDCDFGGCVCPYKLPATLSQELIGPALLDKLYVVGLSIQSDDTANDLSAIATAGGTDPIFVHSGDLDTDVDLQQALKSVLSVTQNVVTTRTQLAYATSSKRVDVDGTYTAAYELRSGFRPHGLQTWSGVLERRRYECDGGTLTAKPINDSDRFHTKLNTQTGRKIYTIIPEPGDSLVRPDWSLRRGVDGFTSYPAASPTVNAQHGKNPLLNSDDSGLGTDDMDSDEDYNAKLLTAMTDADDDVLLGLVGDLDGQNGADDNDVVAAVNWIQGTHTSRDGRKMGAIYHASPKVLGLPPTDTENQTFNTWAKTVTRPKVVFTNTTDGLLHAFALEDYYVNDTKLYTGGDELWAFMPPASLNLLGSAIRTQMGLLDGTPVVGNVLLSRSGSSITQSYYRSVLIAGLRNAAGFIAMDVTDPTAPSFLWQFSKKQMGNTVGQPALTQAVVKWGETTQERAVAILPGGSGEYADDGTGVCAPEGIGKPGTPDDARTNYHCWKHQGRQLYVVDVATGSLIQHFDENSFNAPLTGAIAVNGGGSLGVSTRGYFSDHEGVLWMLDMSDPVASKWTVKPVFDVYHGGTASSGRPSQFAPILSQNEQGELVVIVGTGDQDHLQDSAAHRVYSLTEKYSDEAVRSMAVNWKLQLGSYESVTGPLTLFRNTLYFATYKAVADPSNPLNYCSVGQGKLWAVDYTEAKPVDEGGGPEGRLPAQAAILQGESGDAIDGAGDGEGLVTNRSIGARMINGFNLRSLPTCMQVQVKTDPVGGQYYEPTNVGSPAKLVLRAQVTGDQTAESGASVPTLTTEVPQGSRRVEVDDFITAVE